MMPNFKSARGAKELRAYQEGKKLSLKQMILAKCYDCMCKYSDGKVNCKIPECSLYPMMPYGEVWKHRPKGKIPVGFVKAILQKQKRV